MLKWASSLTLLKVSWDESPAHVIKSLYLLSAKDALAGFVLFTLVVSCWHWGRLLLLVGAIF